MKSTGRGKDNVSSTRVDTKTSYDVIYKDSANHNESRKIYFRNFKTLNNERKMATTSLGIGS